MIKNTPLESEPGKDRSGTLPKPETRPEPADREQRESIFDTSYAPERAELRKAWSRLQRRK